MVDLAITASQVLPGANATTFDGTAAEAVTAGQVCYLNASSQLALADADLSALGATVKGIALNDANAQGQPLRVQTGGTITIGAGAAPTVGEIYVASGTAGGIAPEADLASSDWVSIIGVGGATNTIVMNIFNSGQQVP